MLRIVALIAFLFWQLVVEACPSIGHVQQAAQPSHEAESVVLPASVAPAARNTIDARARAETAVSLVEAQGIDSREPAPGGACGSMTVIRRYERRIRHETIRLRGRQEIS